MFGLAQGLDVRGFVALPVVAPGADCAQGVGVAGSAPGRVIFIAFAAAVGPKSL